VKSDNPSASEMKCLGYETAQTEDEELRNVSAVMQVPKMNACKGREHTEKGKGQFVPVLN
jgi:hypothetical protein